MSRRAWIIVLVPMVLFAAFGPANAQDSEPKKAEAGGEADVVVTAATDSAFPEIAVDFEVKKPGGTYLLDATKADFRVTEDGVEVPIQRFIAPIEISARPTTIVLVLDHSGSMGFEDRIGALKKAVRSFLKELPRGSRVAVVAFSSEVETICPFTEDFATVSEAVESLEAAGGTRFYDAVETALGLLAEEPGRRAILALTDGADTASINADFDSVLGTARKLGLPVHTLGLGVNSSTLKQLAESTRGRFYPARAPDQLRAIYEEIAQRLRSSYSLYYQSSRKIPDGTLRPVRIFYRASQKAGETAVFIPGMVVPAAGWPPLFLALVGGLILLAVVPGRLKRGAGAST